MRFKKTLIFLFTIIIATSGIYSYKKIVSKNHEIEILKDKIVTLEKQIIEVSNSENKETTPKMGVTLKDGNFDIELFSNYSILSNNGEIESLNKPAFGPICSINRNAVESDNIIKIINQENDYLTRISVEGFVPTWVLESAKGNGSSYFEEKQMYVIEESAVLLTPENNSVKVNVLPVGKAVRVLDAYDDWFYIHVFRHVDANEIYKGWINKLSLGYYEDLKTNIGLDVRVEEGYEPEWVQDFPNGLWGKIHEETESTYYLILYGGDVIEIDKENVKPFFIRKE